MVFVLLGSTALCSVDEAMNQAGECRCDVRWHPDFPHLRMIGGAPEPGTGTTTQAASATFSPLAGAAGRNDLPFPRLDS